MKLRILSTALATLTAAFAQSAAAVSGCTPLGNTPITPNVDYDTQIDPILVSCNGGCHVNATPPELGGSFPRLFAISDPRYITPGQPDESFLFHKINCDDPDMGARMPRNQQPLSVAQQALFYDWIAQGARGLAEGVPVSDIVFRSGLETTRID